MTDEHPPTAEDTPHITLMVVDDHAIVRQGLERLFDTVDDIDVVASAANGVEAVAFAESHSPDIILMDLSMPEMDGVEATRKIALRNTSTRVIVLTSFGEESRILEAINAGAHGYLLKHIDPDQLIDAVRAAHRGDSPLDPRAGRVLLDNRMGTTAGPAPSSGADGLGLTARELEVLQLVGTGLANKQIARRLGISERTVKAHLTSAFSRLGVSDRVQAALWVREHLPTD